MFVRIKAELIMPENRSRKTDKNRFFLVLRADIEGDDPKILIILSGYACGPTKGMKGYLEALGLRGTMGGRDR